MIHLKGTKTREMRDWIRDIGNISGNFQVTWRWRDREEEGFFWMDMIKVKCGG